jgi:hypothetical protein
MNSIVDDQTIDYVIDPSLVLGSKLTATLTWYRHVTRFDNGNGIIDANDTFSQSQQLSNLNLQILRNGTLVAESASAVDSLEHLHINVDQFAQYTLRVVGPRVSGGSDEFALAWYATAVPEPTGTILAVIAALSVAVRRRCRR